MLAAMHCYATTSFEGRLEANAEGGQSCIRARKGHGATPRNSTAASCVLDGIISMLVAQEPKTLEAGA